MPLLTHLYQIYNKFKNLHTYVLLFSYHNNNERKRDDEFERKWKRTQEELKRKSEEWK